MAEFKDATYSGVACLPPPALVPSAELQHSKLTRSWLQSQSMSSQQPAELLKSFFMTPKVRAKPWNCRHARYIFRCLRSLWIDSKRWGLWGDVLVTSGHHANMQPWPWDDETIKHSSAIAMTFKRRHCSSSCQSEVMSQRGLPWPGHSGHSEDCELAAARKFMTREQLLRISLDMKKQRPFLPKSNTIIVKRQARELWEKFHHVPPSSVLWLITAWSADQSWKRKRYVVCHDLNEKGLMLFGRSCKSMIYDDLRSIRLIRSTAVSLMCTRSANSATFQLHGQVVSSRRGNA